MVASEREVTVSVGARCEMGVIVANTIADRLEQKTLPVRATVVHFPRGFVLIPLSPDEEEERSPARDAVSLGALFEVQVLISSSLDHEERASSLRDNASFGALSAIPEWRS